MRRSELKRSLKFAVLQSTPDLLPTLLPDYVPQESPSLPTPAANASGSPFGAVPVRRPRFQVACVMAAVCFLFLGAFFLAQPKVESIVSIDVNPSIELTIDQSDRVIKSKASNDDAAAILKKMRLKDKDLQEATDTIITEMVETGYLQRGSTDNAILVSVASRDKDKTEQLQEKVSTSIETVLKENNASAKILRQADTLSDDLQEFARKNKVSVGKADLVRKLTQTDASLDAEVLCQMSLKDLNALIDNKDMEISGLVVHEESSTPNSSQEPDPSEPGESSGSTSSTEPSSKPSANSSSKPSSSASHSSKPASKPASSAPSSEPSSSEPDGGDAWVSIPVDDNPPDIDDEEEVSVPDYPFSKPEDASSAVSSEQSSSSTNASSAVSEKPASSKPESGSSEKPSASSKRSVSVQSKR